MSEQTKTFATLKAFVAPLIAAALVIGGGSFYGGMQYAESARPSGPGGAQRMMPGEGGPEGTFRMRGDGQQGGFRGGQGGVGGFVAGEILAKDDMSITVKLRDGGSKIILYSSTTEIGKFVDGAAADLEIGANVMATGKANQDGSVTAQSIQLRPEGMAVPMGRPAGGAPDAP